MEEENNKLIRNQEPIEIEMEALNVDEASSKDDKEEIESNDKQEEETSYKNIKLLYGVDENPSWLVCFLLGFQQYLTMFGSAVAGPLFLANGLGIENNPQALGKLISTMLVVSGIVTLLQTSIGSRLPIVQGGTFSLLIPATAILSETNNRINNIQMINETNSANITESSDEFWLEKMRLLSGAIAVSSTVQLLIGITGLPGLMMNYIGPITIGPTVAMVGMGLWLPAVSYASENWPISISMMVVLLLFSQYFVNFEMKIPCTNITISIFRLFSVILSIAFIWAIHLALQFTGVVELPDYEEINRAPWFQIIYPGQWGTPTVHWPAVAGMISGVLASIIESIGDYYACARLCGLPPPSKTAINRGIFVEGIGCFLAGVFGNGNGTTSYSENIGAIGITKVASRRVIQCGALLMILLGVISKFGIIFTFIPKPVAGGLFFVLFGMISAVGISNLKFVDLDSPRNLVIIGFSIFVGLAIPGWVTATEPQISTGINQLDQLISIFLRTSMFLTMIVAFVLDNTIPGTLKERGLERLSDEPNSLKIKNTRCKVYDLPDCIQSLVVKVNFFKFIPISPTYQSDHLNKT